MTFAVISESAASDQEATVFQKTLLVEKFKGVGQVHLTVMRPEVLRDQALC